MCSFERSAEFTCGTWSSSSGRNKAFKYGFLVQSQAVCWKKRSFSQQQSRKVHEEMWASLLKKQGSADFTGRWKSFRGVLPWWPVLHVLIILLSHLGQVQINSGTCWVGHSWRKQLGLGYGCSGVPSKGRIFSLPLSQLETGFGRGRTTQRGRSSFCSSCTCSYAYGQGPAIRPHTGERMLATASRYLEGHRTPDEALVC